MAETFNGNLRVRIVLGDNESTALARWKQVRARQKIAGHGLCVASAQTTSGNEVMFGREIHVKEQPTEDRLQGQLHTIGVLRIAPLHPFAVTCSL
jgi:hypothetical protein